MLIGAERTALFVCPISCKYLDSSEALRSTLEKKLLPEQIMSPPDSFFICDGHLQHAAPQRCGKNCLQFHVYIIPNDEKLLDAAFLASETDLSTVTDSENEDGEMVQ